MRRKKIYDRLGRRGELVSLVKVLAKNREYYHRTADRVLADSLLTERDVETTLFTYNKFWVTYGVSFCDDSQIITSYRLYEGDEQIRKTDCNYLSSEIETNPEGFELGPVTTPRNQYERFMGEIMYYDIKDVKIEGFVEVALNVELGELGKALISGMEKVGDRIVKHLQNVKNLGKTFTVSIAKGVKVEVSTDFGDWATMWDNENNEGDVRLYLYMEVNGEEFGHGFSDTYLRCPGGEPDPDSLRNLSNEAYLDLLGEIVRDCPIV